MRRMYSEKQLEEIAGAKTTELVEGGTLENAKPVYCHPILFYNAEAKYRLMMLVMNNDSSAFTLETLFDYIVAHDNFRGLLSGIYNDAEAIYLIKATATSIQVVYHDTNETSGVNAATISKAEFLTLFTGISDSVHKIN